MMDLGYLGYFHLGFCRFQPGDEAAPRATPVKHREFQPPIPHFPPGRSIQATGHDKIATSQADVLTIRDQCDIRVSINLVTVVTLPRTVLSKSHPALVTGRSPHLRPLEMRIASASRRTTINIVLLISDAGETGARCPARPKLAANDAALHLLQIRLSRTRDHRAVAAEARPMTGAIPGALRFIPRNDTA